MLYYSFNIFYGIIKFQNVIVIKFKRFKDLKFKSFFFVFLGGGSHHGDFFFFISVHYYYYSNEITTDISQFHLVLVRYHIIFLFFLDYPSTSFFSSCASKFLSFLLTFRFQKELLRFRQKLKKNRQDLNSKPLGRCAARDTSRSRGPP